MSSKFPTTRWSVVLAAREGAHSARAGDALAELCEAYWYPLYAFVRRRGHDGDEACDLTQGYFARLLEKGYLDDVEPGAGRFRSFLIASLKHFLANEGERRRALKRGGGVHTLSFDGEWAEGRYQVEDPTGVDPERMFEVRWAHTVLDRAMQRLRRSEEEAAQLDRFDRLQGYLTSVAPSKSYRDIAAELGLGEGAVKMAVHRLRRRFGECLRAEISDTVRSRDDVDDELRYLLAVLARSA